MLPIVVLSLTGALLVFELETDRLLNRALWTVPAVGAVRQPYQRLLDGVQRAYRGGPATAARLPLEPQHAVVFSLADGRAVHVDPYTGRILGDRVQARTFMARVRALHVSFFAGGIGSVVAGVASLILVALTATGIVLWWPARWRLLRQRLTIRRGLSFKRTNHDLHNTLGFYSSLVVFVIALTGAVFTFPQLFRPLVYALTRSAPLPEMVDAVVSVAGAPRISIDAALAISAAAVPGTRPTFVTLPQGDTEPLRVNRRLPWEPHKTGRNYVLINPYTGAVVQAQRWREYSLGAKTILMNRNVHTGEFGGMAAQIVWLLGSLAPTVLAATGLLMWWTTRRRARRGQRRDALRAEPPTRPAAATEPVKRRTSRAPLHRPHASTTGNSDIRSVVHP